MPTFPSLHAFGAIAKTLVKHDGQDGPGRALVIQGEGTGFHPAGLPAPDWFIAVNPNGPDDPEDEVADLDACFEPYNQDVMMTVVPAGQMMAVKEALWAQAREDLESHAECDNGGTYATWLLDDGSLLVAGFDNGGSDIAQSGATQSVATLGAQAAVGGSHYDPRRLMGDGRVSDHESGLAALTQRLMASRLQPTRGPVAT